MTSAIKEWVVNEAGLEGLLAMGYDTKLDDQGRPSADCWVPFDEIKQALLVDGVGPKRLKLAMSEKKLGMQLTALGYTSPKEPKSIKAGGKWTTKRVRYGLCYKGSDVGAPDETDVGAPEEEGDL